MRRANGKNRCQLWADSRLRGHKAGGHTRSYFWYSGGYQYRGYKTIYPPLRLRQIHNNSKLELFRTNWSTIPILEIVIDTIPTLKLWWFFGGALRAPYWNCFIWNCLRNLWEQFPILKLLQQQFPYWNCYNNNSQYWNCYNNNFKVWNCLRNLWEQFPILKLYSKVTTTIPTIEIYDKARVLHKSFCEW